VIAQRIAFLNEIDAASFALSEAETASAELVVRPAQLAVIGDFVSRRYGRFSITEKDIDDMITNFTRQLHPVAPTELSVDYDHTEGKAAGWIKKLYKKIRTVAGKRLVELWGDVGWTKPAASAIGNKEYLFFSPMFDREFITPIGKKIGVCLTGGALTNRPFLQGMTAISLSMRDEDVALPVSGGQGAKTMRLHKIKDKDGNEVEVDLDALKDDAEIKKLSQPAASQTPPPAGDSKTVDPNVAAMLQGMNALKDTVTSLSQTIANRDKQDRKSEAERLIDAAIRDGKLLPVEKPTYLLLSETEAGMSEVKKLSARAKNSVIKLRGAGGSTTEIKAGESGEGEGEVDEDNITVADAEVRFEKEIDKLMAADPKLSYDQAMNRAAKEHPRMAELYKLSFRRA
jgi:phage I-like protein